MDYGWCKRHCPTAEHRAAWLRGETTVVCPECQDGYVCAVTSIGEHKISFLHRVPEHLTCYAKSKGVFQDVDKSIPRASRRSLAGLEPWPHSPIPADRQKSVIAKIPPALPDELRCWLMVGPAGTSKLTFAYSAVRDWLTWRIHAQANAARDHISAAYMVSVPEWLEEMQAWDTRGFADKTVQPPRLTLQTIAQDVAASGDRPILLLDEIDKFVPTDTRRNLLFRLVDAVYKADGVIVTTANTTLPDLKKSLGEPIFRRIAGTNDEEEAFWICDFFATARPAKQSKGEPPTQPVAA